MRRGRPEILLLIVLSATLASCGTSAEPHFYTLSAADGVPPHKIDKPVEGFRMAVGPVTILETVDRPELVVRVGANEVTLAEQHRWAQPLRNEIARVIAENLEQYLGGIQVVTYPYHASREVDYRVFVDIQHFDSILGQAVTVDALWSIRDGSGGGRISERTIAQETPRGNGYDALVAAHSHALARLSAEIAEAMREITKRN
jgi:uncharacterized lipoprotein YmbA